MKVKLPVFVFAQRGYDRNISYRVWDSDMTGFTDGVLVGETSIEYEIPADFNMTALEIAVLKAAKDKLQEEYLRQKTILDQKINDLMMLGHEAQEVVAQS